MHNPALFNLNGAVTYLPQRGQVRCANLDGFEALVRAAGGRPDMLLARHGLDRRVLANRDAFIDCQALVDVFEDASLTLADPLFGLRLAAQQSADVFGCVTALVRAAPTVRAGLNAFIKYIPVAHSPMAEMTLLENQATAEFRWQTRADLGANQQANFQAALLDLKLLQALGSPSFKPHRITLTGDIKPALFAEIEQLLGCAVTTAVGYNAIAFDAALLDQPVASANRLVYDLLRSYLDTAREPGSEDLESQVLAYIRTTLSDGGCTVRACARHLGYAPRSLQADLARNGLRFSTLVARERMELARNLLRLPHYTLENVAAALGYSDASSFGRAYRRWAHKTPQQYRAEVVALS